MKTLSHSLVLALLFCFFVTPLSQAQGTPTPTATPPNIVVTPSSVVFAMEVGGSAPTPASLIPVTGNNADWYSTDTSPWFDAAGSGHTPQDYPTGASGEACILTPHSTPAGSYTQYITFHASGLQDLAVRVDFNVTSGTPTPTATPCATCPIIPVDRRTTWDAGVEGGIPTFTTICATLSSGATAAEITAAIAACNETNGGIVKLNSGTYTHGGTITFTNKNKTVLRGAGPGSTILQGYDIHVTATSMGDITAPANVRSWTGGYSQGATSITVDSATGITTGMVIGLDQLNDFNCTLPNDACEEGANGLEVVQRGCDYCSRNGGTRTQTQFVKVTNVSGTTLTISPGLYMPNWTVGKTPQVFWSWTGISQNCGIEDLTLDHTNASCPTCHGIFFEGSWNCWVKNIESIKSGREHVCSSWGGRTEVRHSYLRDTYSSGHQSYGILWEHASSCLGEDNIVTGTAGALELAAQSEGCAFLFNFTYDNRYDINADWMASALLGHAAHYCMNLYEGNWANSITFDTLHGSGSRNTVAFNRLTGTEFTPVLKTQHVTGTDLWKWTSYSNFIGNIIGTVGYHPAHNPPYYDDGYDSGTMYAYGGDDGAGYDCDSIPSPLLCTGRTLWRHGNYTTAGEGEPSTAASQAWIAGLPHTLPDSFYYGSKPTYFQSLHWPPYSGNDGAAIAAMTDSVGASRIPAGYRYYHQVDPPAPTPTPAPGDPGCPACAADLP